MLSKRDREEIQKIVQDELKNALFRTITIERSARQQNEPEKVIRDEEWNVLDFLATYIPRIEGALRGLQEDVDKMKNHVATNNKNLEIVGKTLLSMEKAARILAIVAEKNRPALLTDKENFIPPI